MMNTQEHKVKFSQIKDQLKAAWGKLTDDEIGTYETKPETFFTSVKDKYGTTQEDAQKRINAFKPVEAPKVASVS